MGRANASYLNAVEAALGRRVANGSPALSRAVEARQLSASEREALRRYSRSEFALQEDGKALNASILAGNVPDWAADMDGACEGWTLRSEVLVWRGTQSPPLPGVPTACFTSCSAVERTARRFRSKGQAGGTLAIVLPAGFRLAVPSRVWALADDRRTLGVVRRECELVLPRGTSFERIATVDGLGEGSGAVHRVRVMRAVSPAEADAAPLAA